MQRGTTIEAELLASGEIDEDAYFGGLARMYGLPFLAEIPCELVIDHRAIDSQLVEPRMLRLHHPDRPPSWRSCRPSPRSRAWVQAETQRQPHRSLRHHHTFGDPAGGLGVGEARRAHNAVHRLFDTAQPLSARLVVTGDQGFLAGLLLCVATIAATVAPHVSLDLAPLSSRPSISAALPCVCSLSLTVRTSRGQ